jgi:hypothetical protein
MIGQKYATLTNGQYLDKAFDFYSSGIRLQAHERTKIARSVILRNIEKDLEE